MNFYFDRYFSVSFRSDISACLGKVKRHNLLESSWNLFSFRWVYEVDSAYPRTVYLGLLDTCSTLKYFTSRNCDWGTNLPFLWFFFCSSNLCFFWRLPFMTIFSFYWNCCFSFCKHYTCFHFKWSSYLYSHSISIDKTCGLLMSFWICSWFSKHKCHLLVNTCSSVV